MPIIRQIEFTGKNMNDIFNLPCVQSIHKVYSKTDPVPIVKLWDNKARYSGYTRAFIGDTLVEYDDGTWAIMPPNPQST